MLVSAELRWFWKDALPAGLESWYQSGPFPPGGGRARRDEYLSDSSQTELGIKKRGDRAGVDIKGLVADGTLLTGPFAGVVQLWTKWTTAALSLDAMPCIVVVKTRWIRKFDTAGGDVRELALGSDEQPLDSSMLHPERGCLVELVALQLGDRRESWWTLGFEAFGPLDSVEDSLKRTAQHLAAPAPPSLEQGLQRSYPEWLAECS